jgi:hypothetical protein
VGGEVAVEEIAAKASSYAPIAKRFPSGDGAGYSSMRLLEVIEMAKGQQAPKTNNKPKLSVKEKKQKKKDKAQAKAGR